MDTHEHKAIMSDDDDEDRNNGPVIIDNKWNQPSLSFWFRSTVFKLKPTELLNTEHRSVLLYLYFYYYKIIFYFILKLFLIFW